MEPKFHKSVLLKEVLEFLQVKKDGWYLDATLGDGGHSLAILKAGGNIFGIDADPEALKRSEGRFLTEGIDRERFVLKNGNFSGLDSLIGEITFKGAIFDLGVSSLQFDDPSRGFSFQKDADLDMRMDPKLAVKAADLVNGLHKGELYELFKKYGEEKGFISKRIADAIVLSRPITTTSQLVEVILKVAGRKREQIHPATKVFQALRIAVNDELHSIDTALPKVLNVLDKQGILLIISFHSLEDRRVKNSFRSWQDLGLGKILTDKVITPSEEEIEANYRSRSAKMRVFKKA